MPIRSSRTPPIDRQQEHGDLWERLHGDLLQLTPGSKLLTLKGIAMKKAVYISSAVLALWIAFTSQLSAQQADEPEAAPVFLDTE